MKEFLQTLQDAFPALKNHPVAMARLLVLLIAVGWFWAAKKTRKKMFGSLSSTLYVKNAGAYRWLYVYQGTNAVHEWKYYTSETTGGQAGDDIIWSLVKWPSLKPIDSFRIHGAVGMLTAVDESGTKLLARWQIKHNFDRHPFAMLPARGLKSKLQRVGARTSLFLAGGPDVESEK
jgi:hypothetical protein